jgi:hypothetical protein
VTLLNLIPGLTVNCNFTNESIHSRMMILPQLSSQTGQAQISVKSVCAGNRQQVEWTACPWVRDPCNSSHSIKDDAHSITSNLRCLEREGSVWRLYTRHQKPCHEWTISTGRKSRKSAGIIYTLQNNIIEGKRRSEEKTGNSKKLKKRNAKEKI